MQRTPCLEQGRSSTHERGRNGDVVELMRFEIAFRKGAAVAELCEEQPAEQGPWSARKPFVNADDGAVVLLNLLLFGSQLGDETDVESVLDGHTIDSVAGLSCLYYNGRAC